MSNRWLLLYWSHHPASDEATRQEAASVFGLGVNVPALIGQVIMLALIVALIWFAFRLRNRYLNRR